MSGNRNNPNRVLSNAQRAFRGARKFANNAESQVNASAAEAQRELDKQADHADQALEILTGGSQETTAAEQAIIDEAMSAARLSQEVKKSKKVVRPPKLVQNTQTPTPQRRYSKEEIRAAGLPDLPDVPTSAAADQQPAPQPTTEEEVFAALEAQAAQEMANSRPGDSLRQAAQNTVQAAKQSQAALAQAEADHTRAQKEAAKIIQMYSGSNSEETTKKAKEEKKPPFWKRVVNKIKDTAKAAWASVKSALGVSKKSVVKTETPDKRPEKSIKNALAKVQDAKAKTLAFQEKLKAQIATAHKKAVAARDIGDKKSGLMFLKHKKALEETYTEHTKNAQMDKLLKMENDLTKSAGKPTPPTPKGTPSQGRGSGKGGPQAGV